MSYIMALDAGTTSNRCILFDRQGKICSLAQNEFTQYYPHPGWVEHDPEEIWTSMYGVAREAMKNVNASPSEIAAIGITNQRETTVVWDRDTGRSVCPAIVWQCRRTADMADELKRNGYEETIRQKTGLVVDAYFSATKLRWILDHVPEAAGLAAKGRLAFGTIDSWLIWNLSGGKLHVTDYSNASRTMLFNINTCAWDDDILELLRIPKDVLPGAVPSGAVYGTTDPALFGAPVPIAGAGGDQQCALFGQTCFDRGDVKNTYGTGGFLLMNTGTEPVLSKNGLVTSIAWGLDGRVTYCLEGSVFIAGAAVQWLRDELQLVPSAPATERMALSVPDTNGCYLVPAFTGLGAPYWDPDARGMLVGLTRNSNSCHLARAALDAIAYQVRDVLEVMRADGELTIGALRVDGGAAANNYLCQRQADISEIPVHRPVCVETTALGAAFLAGLTVGFFDGPEELRRHNTQDRIFMPAMDAQTRERDLAGWRQAVRTAVYWHTGALD